MSKFRKIINFLLFFCAILCSMLVITVNSENTVPTDGICEHEHNLDVVQEDTYQDGCLVCKLADMIKKLPSESEITEDNCNEVAEQIQEIDKIKFDLTDEEYEELEKIVGKNVPKYFEAVAALQNLMGNVNLAINKNFVLEDETVLESNDERLKNVSISVEVTPIVGDSAMSTLLLNESTEEPSGKTWAGPTQTFDLSYNSDTNDLVGTYSLPAGGKYRVREVNTNQPIVIDGKTYYTKSVSYNYDKDNKNVVETNDGIEVTTYVGDNTIQLAFANNVTKANVSIKAVDIADECGLEGAHIQILDSGGDVVEKWESTTDAHEVEGLKTGETYTLTVTEAPDGYILPDDVTFAIKNNEDGTASVEIESSGDRAEVVDNTIEIKFEKTKVQIQAVDADERELEGATLKILDSNSDVVEKEWESTTDAHEVKGLKTGETYTLTVTEAPESYILPDDVTFSINDDGTISDFSGNMTIDEDGNTVLLIEFKKIEVQIQAVDAEGQALEGAHIQILYSDGKVVNVADEWDSEEEPHTVQGLKRNIEYTLKTTTTPGGYILPADYNFTINSDGSVNGENITTDENEVLLVELKQVKIGVISGYDEGDNLVFIDDEIELEISRNEETITTTKSGYYYIPTDLKAGNEYTLKVNSVPDGYILPADATFSINDDGGDNFRF